MWVALQKLIGIATGTASHEALHAELMLAVRQKSRLHQSMLETTLVMFQVGTFIAHDAALPKPTSRQMTESTVLEANDAKYETGNVSQ